MVRRSISLPSGADAKGGERTNYYVDVIGETQRVASIIVRCADDALVVAWARQVIDRGHYAAVRIERKGSILNRLPRA